MKAKGHNGELFNIKKLAMGMIMTKELYTTGYVQEKAEKAYTKNIIGKISRYSSASISRFSN